MFVSHTSHAKACVCAAFSCDYVYTVHERNAIEIKRDGGGCVQDTRSQVRYFGSREVGLSSSFFSPLALPRHQRHQCPTNTHRHWHAQIRKTKVTHRHTLSTSPCITSRAHHSLLIPHIIYSHNLHTAPTHASWRRRRLRNQSQELINVKLLLIASPSVGKSSPLLRFSDKQGLPRMRRGECDDRG
jgi:hypothetical protein